MQSYTMMLPCYTEDHGNPQSFSILILELRHPQARSQAKAEQKICPAFVFKMIAKDVRLRTKSREA
jgi:hypothetical protein